MCSRRELPIIIPRRFRMRGGCCWAISAALLIGGPVVRGAVAEELPPAAKKTVDFRRDVYPLLASRCFGCHAGSDAESGYRLDDRAEILGETNGEPLVIKGKSAQSRLIELVAGLDKKTVMPPKGKRLTAAEVGLLRAWIDQGLTWDESLLPPVLSKTDHWAFQPIKRPPVPTVADSDRVLNRVDAFIAARHKEQGLRAAAAASRRVLIRRLSLDLLGLPPTPEEVSRFLADRSPQAYKSLVGRLLASPHYGQRWGRHWLDVARWSETEGYESNHPRRFAWRYRDWVVEALNRDKPFDEFVRQQVAGDELVPYSDENLIATGFLAAARISSNEEDKWLQRNQMLVDVVNATSSAFLGLTVNCAQCHNHKFDPISTRDYYRLLGFFLPGQPLPVALSSSALKREYQALGPSEYEQVLALKTTLFEKARARLVADVRKTLSPRMREALDTPADRRSVEQELLARKVDLKFQTTPKGIEKQITGEDRKLYDALKNRLTKLQEKFTPPQTYAWYSPLTSEHPIQVLPQIGFYPLPYKPEELARRRPYLQIRGEVHNIGPKLTPGWPAIFDTVFERNTVVKRRGRTELADWLSDPRHPLVARVWVNRIWHFHFGRGIVATPNDFGVRGERPTHPKLLDWLASELIDSGWSTKHIHRLIVMSATYRQSSAVTNREFLELDGENRYLWHWRPRRLEAEAIRDSILAVSGELDERVGGESVPLGRAAASNRRSLYLYQKRGVPPDVQKLFDGPSEASESCGLRQASVSPLQSLYLLNNEFTGGQAGKLADRIKQAAGDDRHKQIELAFVLTLNRQPDDGERKAAEKFLTAFVAPENETSAGRAALREFCLALLNLNEFVSIE